MRESGSRLWEALARLQEASLLAGAAGDAGDMGTS